MDEHEARCVARVLAEADGGIFTVPPLIRLVTALLPGWDWDQLVADVNPTVAGPADLARLTRYRDELHELAQANGITDLRWDSTEGRLVGTYGGITFSEELAFQSAAAELLGRAVPIISDNTASTRDAQGYEPL